MRTQRIGAILIVLAALPPLALPSGTTLAASPSPVPAITCGTASLQPSANVGTAQDSLEAVAAVPGTTQLWAVGYYIDAAGSSQTLTERFSNGVWSSIPSPSSSGDLLYGVAAVSANDVWAVGLTSPVNQTLVEHWNGSAWTIVSSPNPSSDARLDAVAAISASDIWAVGSYFNGSANQTLTEHWNGSTWSIIRSSSPGGDVLVGVTAVSTNDVWAVGQDFNGTTYQSLIEQWNGDIWSVIPSPGSNSEALSLFGIAAVSANDIWAVGGAILTNSPQPALIENWNGSSWNTIPSPNPSGTYDVLYGVAAVSATNVWAVGIAEIGSTNRTLIEHWNGSSWSAMNSPNPGSGGNRLFGVAAVSAGNVWAVGDALNGSTGATQALIEHWNGSGWTLAASSDPVLDSNELNGVAAISANDVWAVGDSSSSSSGVTQPLTEQWNGSSWNVVAGPSFSSGTTKLDGVTAVSANDVWAVGTSSNGSTVQTFTEQWNGTSWNVVPSPNHTSDNGLLAVSRIPGSSDAWAVGYAFSGNIDQTLTEEWNGSSWNVIPSPNPAGATVTELEGVVVVSASNAWAVGYTYNGSTFQTLIERWNGTTWRIVSSPNPGSSGNSLYGVTALSASNIWAVGFTSSSSNSSHPLIEHWNGSSWSVVPNPGPSGIDNGLYGVTAVSSSDVWAVGLVSTATTSKTLVERWNGSGWSVITSANPNASSNYLSAAAHVPGSSQVWAVGAYADPITDLSRTLTEESC